MGEKWAGRKMGLKIGEINLIISDVIIGAMTQKREFLESYRSWSVRNVD